MTLDKLARFIVSDYCLDPPGSEPYLIQVDQVTKTLASRLIDDGDPMTRMVWVPIDTTAEGEPI